MKLSKTIREAALSHAKEEFPKEAVGIVHVVKGRNRYFPCKNLAEDPTEHFILNPDDYIAAEDKGEITAIIHSHPGTNHSPSTADKVACEKSGIPWFIVNPQTELWSEYNPIGFELPYVGREFSHGLIDCYSLCRDWYKKEFKLDLKDYERRDDWWHKGENLYLENFKKEGFHEIAPEKLSELEYGDAILMCIESPVPNHAAIYLGSQLILHHVQGRLSSRDVYGGYYYKATAACLRHESR